MDLTSLNKDRKRRKTSIDMGSMVYGKVPPQAKEIEEVVLGAILLERSAIDVVSDIIKSKSFYIEANQLIFNAMQGLQQKNMPIDILTVVEELKFREQLDAVGGPYYVTKLSNSVVSTANIDAHARIVQQKFIQRELIRISGEIIGQAYEDSADVFDMLDHAEDQFFQINNGNLQAPYKSSADLAVKGIHQIEQLRQRQEDLTGVPTGYPILDRLTCGWQSTDLIILAARPSVGKTAFALNLALHAAGNIIKPTRVGIFSLEMSSGQLTNRCLSTISQVHLNKISRGRMDDHEFNKILLAGQKFGDMKIQIDDAPALNIYQLRSKARRMVDHDGVGMIIIDYLQLMSGVDTKSGNREQEVSGITRGLKGLAKELHVPVIALSQLSRTIENRKGQEPQLSDLRESGAIEQDADMVAFLMRDDYGHSQGEVDPALRNKAWVKVKKHRNGDLDDIPFYTRLDIQTWFDQDQFRAFDPVSAPSVAAFGIGNWKPVDIPKTILPVENSQNKTDDSEDDLPF